jgi:type VI secretion system secreted protein Hcp
MAFQSYISFKGKKQGQLKAASPKAGRTDKWTDVISFEMGSTVPVDTNSGEVKGFRQHEPLKVTMERGPASPQLLQGHWTNEVFDEVVLEMVNRTATGGKEQVTERVTLKDAVIVGIRRFTNDHAKEKVENDVDQLEEISFRFRQITVEAPLSSTSASDDWNTPGS